MKLEEVELETLTDVDTKFYKITIDKKINITIKENELRRTSHDELSKEFNNVVNKLSPILNISLNRRMIDLNDVRASIEEVVYVQLYIRLLDRIQHYLERNSNGLYLLYSPKMDLLKIGITNNLNERIKNINRDIGDEVEVLEFYEECSTLEKILHKKFKSDNVRFIGKTGTNHKEWFKNKDYIRDYFKTI